MRVVICGGRDFEDAAMLERATAASEAKYAPITELLVDAQSGVAELAETWAARRQIPIQRFLADWTKEGRAAGFLRNQQMVAYADAVPFQMGGCIALPGGKRTANMVHVARRVGLFLLDWRRGERA